METHPASHVQGLPPFSRHITTHNAEGVAIFHTPDTSSSSSAGSGSPSPSISTDPTWTQFPSSAFGLAYTTESIPADFTSNTDVDRYASHLQTHPGLTIKEGSVLRVVDMAPLATSPMHRTVSMDYGVVLEGEVELELDSGEKRLLRKGDIFVQRGTAHLWRNPSSTQPMRLMIVHLGSLPVSVPGKGELGEFMG